MQVGAEMSNDLPPPSPFIQYALDLAAAVK